MTLSPRHFSRSTKRDAYKRAGGCCENPSCGIALPPGYGGIHFDHRIAWAISRDSSLDNCQCLCTPCHQAKSAGSDVPTIAKVQRLADERIGIKRATKKLPAGRDSPVRKKISGEVIARPTRYEAHRRAMANRRVD